jgi:hypothetical protein
MQVSSRDLKRIAYICEAFSKPIVLCLLPALLSGCFQQKFSSSPVSKTSIDGVVLLGNNFQTFSPCGSPERWFLTTEKMGTPGEPFFTEVSQGRDPYTTSSNDAYSLVDSLDQPPIPPDTLRKQASFPYFSADSLRAKLRGQPDVDPDTVQTVYIQANGYATEYSRFGPLQRYDRLFVVDDVAEAWTGNRCGLMPPLVQQWLT